MFARRFVHLLRVLLIALAVALPTGEAIGATAAGAPVPAQLWAIQYFDLLGGGNPEAAAKLISPGAVLHTPEGEFAGTMGTAEFADALAGSFDDIAFGLQSLGIAGETVVVQFSMSGVHRGEYLGVEATCSSIAVPGIATLRLDDGLISEQWISYDRQVILDQVSVSPVFDETGSVPCDAYQDGPAPSDPVDVPQCGTPWCRQPD